MQRHKHGSSLSIYPRQSIVNEYDWTPYSGDTMDATCFVVSTNDMILNCSCRDMEVGVSYVKSLHKTETMKQSL